MAEPKGSDTPDQRSVVKLFPKKFLGKMFCPKCGKKGRGLCFTCLLEENPVKIKKTSIEVCECGKVKHRQKWITDLINILPEITKKTVKFPEKIKVKDVSVVPKPKKNMLTLDATFILEYDKETLTKTLTLNADVIKKACPSCRKTTSRYFEAVLQVREKKPPITPHDEEISDVKNLKGGVDYYLKSVSHARKIAREYKRRGYIVSESEKLVGQRDGKNIYRVYFSVKPPSYAVGDIIELDGGLFQIASLGENTKLIGVTSDITKKISTNIAVKSKLIAKKEDLSDALVSNVTPHETQAINLSSGEVFNVEGYGRFREGEEVSLLLHHGKAFILKRNPNKRMS